MRVLVFGAGAVGLGLASCLLKAGHFVTLIGREQTVQALRRSGLGRLGIFGSHAAQPQQFDAHTSVAGAHTGEPYDYVLVCTKSFDSPTAAEALADVSPLLRADTPIVLCQNGWGNAEVFAARFGQDRVLNARVITGFCRPSPHQVEITVHAEPIHVGSIFDPGRTRAADLCEAISAGGIPTRPTLDIARDLWAKMCYNCSLNPLGAILSVPYGTLADQAATRAIMDGIIDEIFAVMGASGYSTHVATPAAYRDLFYGKLVPPTAAHRSSMLQDITSGKPTEIDALSGAVIRLGAAHDVATPVNECVRNMVRFLEERAGPRD